MGVGVGVSGWEALAPTAVGPLALPLAMAIAADDIVPDDEEPKSLLI